MNNLYLFGNIFEFCKKSGFPAGDGLGYGEYPFFTSSDKLTKRIDSYVYETPSLIFGSGGKASVHYCDVKFNTSNDCIVSKPKNINETFPKYIYYYLRKNFHLIENGFKGAGLKHISKDYISKINIPLPSLSEQKRIAEILDKADSLRQKRKESIALLDEFLRSVFLYMFGDPVRNEKGWEIEEFGNIISSIRYGTGSPPEYSIAGIPFIRATNIKNGTVVEKGLVYIDKLEASTIEKCKLNEGNLVLVRSGINSGDCALINKKYSGSYAGYDLIIEINYPNNVFTNYFINSIYGKRILKPLSRRAGQPHLNAEQIQSMKIIDPPLNLQAQFAKIVEQVEATKAMMEESLKEMDNQFNGLLQRAFR